MSMDEETKNNNVKRPFPWRKYGLLTVAVLLVGRTVWLWPRTNWSLKEMTRSVSVSQRSSQAVSKEKIRNVVLISIDTCRADHLGCYGYSRKTSPNIDAVAADGVLFNHAVTAVPLTLPSHSSMLTGNTPLRHGVRDNNNYRLGSSNITLAEILKENGFATVAAVGAFVLDSQFGLDQGFDIYDDTLTEETPKIFFYSERSGEEVANFTVRHLEKYRSKKTFFFLHFFDPHAEYEPHKQFRFSSSFLRLPRDLYDGEIAYTDYCIGQIVNKLKELNLYDSALLIITADHGESLGQHSESTHGYFTYHSTLHVPLIIKAPGWPKGIVINNVVGLIDIVPTVCGFLGIDIPVQVEGKDLNVLLSGDRKYAEDRYLYFESLLPTKFGLAPFFGLMTNRFKYIHTAKPELYDLLKNPGETGSLLKKHPQITQTMQDRLKSIIKEKYLKQNMGNKIALTDEARKRLQSLGYVATRSVSENIQFEQAGRDPKEFIEVYNSYEKFLSLATVGKFDKAKKLCNKMLDKWPDIKHTYYLLGMAASLEKDMDAIISHFSTYLSSIAPDSNNTDTTIKHDYELGLIHRNLGQVFALKGQHDRAVEHYKKSLSYNPYNSKVSFDLAGICFKLGKAGDAAKYYKKTLELKPGMPEATAMMGGIYLNQGYLEKAAMHFNKALKAAPDLKEARQGLNTTIQQKRLVKKNITSLLQSLQKDPNQASSHEKLGLLLYRLDNSNKAIYHWNKSLELKSDQPLVLNKLAWAKASSKDESLYDPEQAVNLAVRACELTSYKNAPMLDTLSVAYASAGKFKEAVKTAEKALDLAVYTKQNNLAVEIEEHLELFKAGRSSRQE